MPKKTQLDRRDLAQLKYVAEQTKWGANVAQLYQHSKGEISKAAIKKWLQLLADNGIAKVRRTTIGKKEIDIYMSFVSDPFAAIKKKIDAE